MPDKNLSLTRAEWNLMECLWETAPRSGREAAEHLQQQVGWKRSTTLTMLRRMTQKGLIRCEEKNGINVYFPMVERDKAVTEETNDFLNRVYKGSISMMVSAFTEKQSLTKDEIEELYATLRDVESGGERK